MNEPTIDYKTKRSTVDALLSLQSKPSLEYLGSTGGLGT